MGKPRATRRHPIIVSSDSDEDEPHSPPPKRPRTRTLTSLPRSGNNGSHGVSNSSKQYTQTTHSSKPPSSLPKQKSPSKSPSKPKPFFKPITSFFANVPQRQWSQPTLSPEKSTTDTVIEEEVVKEEVVKEEEEVVVVDEIIDSSPDEATQRPRKVASVSIRTKRERTTDGAGADNEAFPKSSQRFIKAKSGVQISASQPQNNPPPSEDERPWNEKYGPSSLDELAVHKRKVSDVRNWLCDVFSGQARKRLLLLKGPAGTGKTITMSLLSNELGIELHEWKNPTTATYGSEEFVSVMAQFEDFVGRTGKFGSLEFDNAVRTSQPASSAAPSSKQKQLILVEEFPNTFTRSSSGLQAFRSSVLHFLAAHTPSATSYFSGQHDPTDPITPIVMIVTETMLSTNTAAADSFTAHRLLGTEILTHPGVTVIEFNPVAPTYMEKALQLVVLKEARKSGRRKTPGPQVLLRLSEIGDVRSAVSSLEFLCLRGDAGQGEEGGGWGSKIAFGKPKKAPSKDVPLTKMEQESLEMVTQRESTLGLFHAVGRVCYNKRLDVDPTVVPTPQPPNWFPERRRPKASEVQIDALLDELGADIQTFVSALHENYVLSCEGSTEEDTLDSIDGCIEALSNADVLSTDRFSTSGYGRRTFQTSSSDDVRADEMSFQESVRGLLFYLPYPVKRIAPPAGTMTNKGNGNTKANAYRMYYPASLRLWRQQEEIGGLLDLWISKAQRGDLFTSITATKPPEAKAGSVETWKKTTPFSQQHARATRNAITASQTSRSTQTVPKEEERPSVLLGGGGSARYEMLLERLPYLPFIMRRTSTYNASTSTTVREIQKITAFTGIGGIPAIGDEEEDEGDEAPVQEGQQWSTDAPTAGSKGEGTVRIKAKVEEGASALPIGVVEKEGEGLVLSDDDIEDF
ncbi:Rad17-domain-containing protein [Delitschia confertaspora ATCC 74209]|uniref:Rad17-domain-containing protein n=1 Tax=Delitschia confertaspora ATCC 74209 TaxID=1513339 RepID=A0A9P4MSW7_9PLEO|nr:Rad17-domain-containing protein [Delitschia confertaspora ATCC 74209]